MKWLRNFFGLMSEGAQIAMELAQRQAQMELERSLTHEALRRAMREKRGEA